MSLTALLLALSLTPSTPDWPQWRGPDRDGFAPGRPWPDSLAALAPRWRVDDLGPSYAGPIVGPRAVFTVGTVDGEREVVRALDRTTGAELWQASWEGAMQVPFFAARNGSWVRSTPAFDGESLYVGGMRDVLVCLDAATGEPRWSVDFVAELDSALPAFGLVCSPLLDGDDLFVQAGGGLCKLDKRTGEILWRSLVAEKGVDSAFSSPVLATLDGSRQLLVQTREELVGVDPADGTTLWSRPIQAFRGMNILTPVPIDEHSVFTASYGGRAQLVGVEDGATSQAWENRAQGYMSTPVVIDGHVYLFTRSNRLTCIDLATGEEAWISPPTGDEYWSLVARGDRILALSESGMLRLVRATPASYQVLAERELVDDQETWAHLAVVGDELYVRAQEALIALSWKEFDTE